ncbi:hypothetical protein SDC9_162297 [bioreactor metagenome]|uniref:Uncharacterized protein n=1 Tax=bioreactor metagenome TaxID=1076179 RepID=A0A645FKN3_9ZZZZ
MASGSVTGEAGGGSGLGADGTTGLSPDGTAGLIIMAEGGATGWDGATGGWGGAIGGITGLGGVAFTMAAGISGFGDAGLGGVAFGNGDVPGAPNGAFRPAVNGAGAAVSPPPPAEGRRNFSCGTTEPPIPGALCCR